MKELTYRTAFVASGVQPLEVKTGVHNVRDSPNPQDIANEFTEGQCLSRLLPRFKWLPVAPDGSRWLLLIQTHAVCGSQWLPMTPIDFHRVSLLPNPDPKRSATRFRG